MRLDSGRGGWVHCFMYIRFVGFHSSGVPRAVMIICVCSVVFGWFSGSCCVVGSIYGRFIV